MVERSTAKTSKLGMHECGEEVRKLNLMIQKSTGEGVNSIGRGKRNTLSQMIFL